MTQEEKAKAYDELIAKLIKAKEDDMLNDERYCCVIDEIVPELKESEDERIRKELIAHCRNTRCVTEEGAERIVKFIDWLEKQKPIDEDEIVKGIRRGVAISLINHIDANSKGMYLSNMECEDIENAIINEDWDNVYGYMKKKLEQKLADKVEQKLKIGDRLKLNGIEDTPIVRIIESIEEKDGNYIYSLIDDGTNDTYDHWIEFKDKNWSVDDEMMVLGVRHLVGCASLLNIALDKLDKINLWLKSLKDRIQCAYISQKNFNEVNEK